MRQTLLVIVVALAAGACGTGGSGQTAPTAQLAVRHSPTAEATDAMLALARRVPCPTRPVSVTTGEWRSFNAVTAVTCSQESRDLPGQGQWLVDVRRFAISGVPALEQALQQPDEPVGSGPCAGVAVGSPSVALIDAAGRALVPVSPRGVCGWPLSAVLIAFRHVDWQDSSVHKVRQLVSPQAQSAKCEMKWKNENWMATRFGGHPHLSDGGPVFPVSATSVHVCLYRVQGADLEVGDFQTGFAMTGARAAALLRALQGKGPARSCADQREFAVITVDPGIYANVELGGCWRVQRPYPDHGVGSADPTTTGALLLKPQ